LLLLLDGLDEVRGGEGWGDRRSACVGAINEFLRGHGGVELLICCRAQDYEGLRQRLQVQSAVFIQPLTTGQVMTYLESLGAELQGVRLALGSDPILQELARSPLLLNIITLAYRGLALTDLPQLTPEERRHHLFDQYIQRMLARRGGPQTPRPSGGLAGRLVERRAGRPAKGAPIHGRSYNQRQAMGWLIGLARQMQSQSQSIFLIEQVQPSWLAQDVWRWGYRWALMAIFVGLLWLGGMWFLTQSRLLVSVGFSIVIFGPIFGSLQINTVETLRWSWKKARRNILPNGVLGAVLGLGFKVIYEWLLHPLHGGIFAPGQLPWNSIVRGIVFGMSAGLLFGFIRSWKGPAIRQKATEPNQGIWQSGKHGGFFAFFGMLFLGTAATTIHHGFMNWGIWGLLFGWTLGGGEACIKHGLLRLMLWRQGEIPWNYAQFLDWATERIFLQKVGGGYIFTHRLLLEHFSGLPLANRK
jgi:hypothetical protein